MARPRKPRDRDPAWVALGDAIARRRTELGMRTQAALADAAGLTFKTIGELERGDRAGGYERTTLAAVEQALQWPPGTIHARVTGGLNMVVGGTTTPVPARSLADLPPVTQSTVDRLVELLGDTSALTDDDRQRLGQMVSAVVETFDALERERANERNQP